MFKKSVILIACCIMFFSLPIFASAKGNTGFTEKDFVKYIQDHAQQNPQQAAETLDQFKKLNSAEKEAFLKVFSNEELLTQAMVDPEQNNARFVSTCSPGNSTSSAAIDAISPMGISTYTTTCQNDFQLAGVTVTTLKTWVQYTQTSTQYLQILNKGQDHTNWSIFYTVDEKGFTTGPYFDSSYTNLYATSRFVINSISIPGVSYSKYQHLSAPVTGNGPCWVDNNN